MTATDHGSPVRRSLFLHAPIRRRPRVMLERMLALVDEDTPPDGPDGPVAVLERRLADLLGKPAALFFPTGTMAQQVALRVHADRRGRRAFAAHPQSHLDVWEEQGYSAVHGMWFHRTGDPHELMRTADLAAIGELPAAVVWELPRPRTRTPYAPRGCGGSGSAAASPTPGRWPWPLWQASTPWPPACPPTAPTRSPSRRPSTPTATPTPTLTLRRRRCSTSTCPPPGGRSSGPARRSWLDLEAGIAVIASQTQRIGNALVQGPPKTDAGRRTIALDHTTVAALRRHRHRQQAELAALGTDGGGYVFTNTCGRPLGPDGLSVNFIKLLATSGLPPVRLHDLRHGVASLALQAGADLKVVQDQLGHSSIVLTADTYITVVPEIARKTAEDVARLILNAGRYAPGAHHPRRPSTRPLVRISAPRGRALDRCPTSGHRRVQGSRPPRHGERLGPTTASPWPHHEQHSSAWAGETAGQDW
ncbi:hypothetical protein GCM10029978_112540 [Actinoallomurus acanthiterrae]